MENREHYLRIMLEELEGYLKLIRQSKSGAEAIKLQEEIINNFYRDYKDKFQIESIDSIKKILKEIEHGNEER